MTHVARVFPRRTAATPDDDIEQGGVIMTNEQLDAIRERCENALHPAGADTTAWIMAGQQSARDIPNLLDEVERLQSELDKANDAIAAWNRRVQPKARVIPASELPMWANKWIWYQDMKDGESRWFELDKHVADNPGLYHYGDTWRAYDRQPEGELS